MSSSSPRAQLEDQVRGLLPRLWDVAPDLASQAGATGWDHLLPEPSLAALEQRSSAYDQLLDGARELATKLGVGSQDCDVLAARIDLFNFATFEIRNWRHNPDPFSFLGGLLFDMLLKQRGDTDQHFTALAARCTAIPGYLETFRAGLGKPDRLWVDTARRVTGSMGSLFSALVPSAKRAGASHQTLLTLEAASRGVAASADDHRRWLEGLTDSETIENRWLLSDDHYSRLLELKQLKLSLDDVETIGHEQLALRIAQRDSHPPPSGQPPRDFEEAIRSVREVVERSRRFVTDRNFATFPVDEELVVRATPSFLRPIIPFAAMISSGVLEQAQRSVYLVSEPEDADLSELRLARITGVAVHEGYPGHHLQLSAANQRSSILRARIVGAPGVGGEAALGTDLVEGWAHYVEEKMQEEGFGCLPGAAWVLRNDQVWRAVRILIDVGMCRGRMNPTEAVGMLVEHAGLSKASAEAEVRRYTVNPSYQLCYLIGKLKLDSLKEDLLEAWGEAGSERRFHNTVLEAGCIPVEMLRDFC